MSIGDFKINSNDYCHSFSLHFVKKLGWIISDTDYSTWKWHSYFVGHILSRTSVASDSLDSFPLANK